MLKLEILCRGPETLSKVAYQIKQPLAPAGTQPLGPTASLSPSYTLPNFPRSCSEPAESPPQPSEMMAGILAKLEQPLAPARLQPLASTTPPSPSKCSFFPPTCANAPAGTSTCHAPEDHGKSLGKNRTSVSARRNPASCRLAVLEPPSS